MIPLVRIEPVLEGTFNNRDYFRATENQYDITFIVHIDNQQHGPWFMLSSDIRFPFIPYNHMTFNNSLASSVISYRDYSTEKTNCPPEYIPWSSGHVLKCKVNWDLFKLRLRFEVDGVQTTPDPIIMDKLGFIKVSKARKFYESLNVSMPCSMLKVL